MHDDPLERFENEHREALEALSRLEEAATTLESGQDVAQHLQVVADVKRFLETAVRTHNDNEERALFPLLGEGAPTELFVEEHGTLRTLERQLGAALETDDAAGEVPALAFAIVDLLRSHIEREDKVLFPIARQVLGVEGLAKVAAELDREPSGR